MPHDPGRRTSPAGGVPRWRGSHQERQEHLSGSSAPRFGLCRSSSSGVDAAQLRLRQILRGGVPAPGVALAEGTTGSPSDVAGIVSGRRRLPLPRSAPARLNRQRPAALVAPATSIHVAVGHISRWNTSSRPGTTAATSWRIDTDQYSRSTADEPGGGLSVRADEGAPRGLSQIRSRASPESVVGQDNSPRSRRAPRATQDRE